jgi:glucose/arabinose dehydrogenase
MLYENNEAKGIRMNRSWSIWHRTAPALLIAVAIAAAAMMSACDDDDDDNGNLEGGAETTPTASAQTPSGGETPPKAAPQLTDSTLKMEEISGLDQPTQIVFLGPDDLLVSQKTGSVVRVTSGEVQSDPVLELAANYADERGVLGLTLHPQFAQNHFVYIYWTWRGKEGQEPDSLLGEATDDLEEVPQLGNRVDRFVWDGSKLTWDRNLIELPSRTTDLTLDRRRGNHDAGVINFGPDGKLYVVIGDQNNRGQLQNVTEGPAPDNPDELLAAVLRLNDDGSIPQDNPFVGVNETVAPIWIYGVRNSFGYDFDPKSGELWLEVNGQAAHDIVSRYEKGNNIGWIQILGNPDRYDEYVQLESEAPRLLDNPSYPPSKLAPTAEEAINRLFMMPGATYVPPQFTFKYAVAPAGLGFVDGTALGADHDGSLLMGDVNTGSIYEFHLTDDRMSLDLQGGLADGVNDNTPDDSVGEMADSLFATGIFVATEIEQGPDGTLWIASNADGKIFKITGP